MTKRKKLKVEGSEVRPVFEESEGPWLLVKCPEGHLLRCVRWGEFTSARKTYGRGMICPKC